MSKHADLYMGIAAAITELHRIQHHLAAFNLTPEQRLNGAEEAIKNVGEYLIKPDKMYAFDDLCHPEKEAPTDKGEGRE